MSRRSEAITAASPGSMPPLRRLLLLLLLFSLGLASMMQRCVGKLVNKEVYLREMEIYKTHETHIFDNKPEVYISCDEDGRDKIELKQVRDINKLYKFDPGTTPITYVETATCRVCRVKEADPLSTDDVFGEVNVCEADFESDGYAKYSVPDQFDIKFQCEECIVLPPPEEPEEPEEPAAVPPSPSSSPSPEQEEEESLAPSVSAVDVTVSNANDSTTKSVSKNGTAGEPVSVSVSSSGNGSSTVANASASPGSANTSSFAVVMQGSTSSFSHASSTPISDKADSSSSSSSFFVETPTVKSQLTATESDEEAPQPTENIDGSSSKESNKPGPEHTLIVLAILLVTLVVGVVVGGLMYRSWRRAKERREAERMAEFEAVLGDPDVDFERIAEQDIKAFDFKLGSFKKFLGSFKTPKMWERVPGPNKGS